MAPRTEASSWRLLGAPKGTCAKVEKKHAKGYTREPGGRAPGVRFKRPPKEWHDPPD